MGRLKIEGICSVVDCGQPLKCKGMCQYHYNKQRLEWNPEKANSGLRGHPFYSLWFERKQSKILCEDWLDFKIFIKDISPKPDGEFFLVRLRNEPFGPDNFKWQKHLKRKEGEAKSDWWARKREARIAANPSMESDRNIKRVFGLTRDDYNKLLAAQNFVCAICEQPETSVNANTGTIKALAVDHDHETGKIRNLLCWRCNGTLGKAEDNIELLQKMIVYLNKHKGTKNG